MRISSDEDSPVSTLPARALRSMQTGQNSIAPENSLPQLGHVRRGSVFMGLTALQPRYEPKSRKQHHAPPSGAKSASTAPGKLLSRSTSDCVPILARQITFRNKIPMTWVTCLFVRAPTRSRSPSLGNTVIKPFAFQGLTQRMDYSPLLYPPLFRYSERRL